MTANQSGGNDSEHIIQQSSPDGQAAEDTNPANLSSNPPEASVSTNEGESPSSMSLHDVDIEIHFSRGVFAHRNLPQGHEIIGAERPLFEVPQLGEASAWRRKDLNATEAECFDKFKRDHNCNPSITTAIISSLASETHRACPDCAQATFRIAETYDITLTLLKDVRKGDEICIGFGQTPTRFVCSLCDTRERTWKWRKRQLKRLLAKLYPRDMSKTAEPPSE